MLRQPFLPGLCLRSVNHNDTCFGLIGGTGVVTKLRDVRLSGMKGPLPNAWLVDSLREIGGAGRNRTADKGNSFDAKQKPTCQFVSGGGLKTLEAKIKSLDA